MEPVNKLWLMFGGLRSPNNITSDEKRSGRVELEGKYTTHKIVVWERPTLALTIWMFVGGEDSADNVVFYCKQILLPIL